MVKISNLPSNTTPGATDPIPAVSGGVTVRETITDMMTSYFATLVWTTWTPTWTNFTTTSGTLNYAKYSVLGKTTFFKISFTLGASSAVTGQIIFSLPNTMVNDAVENNGYYYDTSAGTFFELVAQQNTSTTLKLFAKSYNGAAAGIAYLTQAVTSATVPVAFATGDVIEITGSYENS